MAICSLLGRHGNGRWWCLRRSQSLIGFLFVLAVAAYIQNVRNDCSMSNMIGVDWLECLFR